MAHRSERSESAAPSPARSLFGLSAATVAGRAILDARPIHVHDLSTAADYPEGRTYADQFGYRTTLAVALAREAAAVGALLITQRGPSFLRSTDRIAPNLRR